MFTHDDPFELILDSLQGTLGNVFLLQLLGFRYNTMGLSMDTKLAYEIDPDRINLVLSLKEAGLLDVISPYFVRLDKVISLHVIVTGMETHLNLTDFLKPGIAKIHVVCDNVNCCQVEVKPITKSCPILTHLLIRGMGLDDSVSRNLCQAIMLRKLPHLSHLDIDHAQFTLMEKFRLFFASPWPELTHLGLAACFLDRSDVEVLLQHDRLLPKLTSLHLFLGSPSDAGERKQLEGHLSAYIPILRDIDIPLFSLIRVQLPSLRKLWLYDMNKNEYKNIVTLVNDGCLPNLTELGISMCSLAAKQVLPQIRLQMRFLFGHSGKSVIHHQMIELIIPVTIKTLTHLTLHRFIYSVQHLDTVARCIAQMQLEKLDISHSAGITGHLSKLFTHRLLLVEFLILSNCELNSDDLRSLAKANEERKFPELKHLDLSQNEGLQAEYEYLFSDCTEWNELLQLNCDQPSANSDQDLESLVNSGCLKSLHKLIVSVFEGKILRENQPDIWPALTELEVRVPFMTLVEPLRNISIAVESGLFPKLEKLCLTLSFPETDSKKIEALRKEILSLQRELNKKLPDEIANHVMGSLINVLVHTPSNSKFVTDKELVGKSIPEITQQVAIRNFESVISSMIDTLSKPINDKQRKILNNALSQFWTTNYELLAKLRLPSWLHFWKKCWSTSQQSNTVYKDAMSVFPFTKLQNHWTLIHF